MKTYALQLGFADPRFAPMRAGIIDREVAYKKQILPEQGYDRLVVHDLLTGQRSAYRFHGTHWVDERDWRRFLRDGE